MTSKIGMLFLASRSDVLHPRHATYKPSGHTYSHMRQYKREMTLLEVMEIYKKNKSKRVVIYSSGFNVRRMRKKGYQDTQIYFLKSTSNCV